MGQYASRIIEGTLVAIVLLWVVVRNQEFGQVIKSVSSATVGSVKALQGR